MLVQFPSQLIKVNNHINYNVHFLFYIDLIILYTYKYHYILTDFGWVGRSSKTRLQD